MSGKWDDPHIPKTGWSCVQVTDNEEPDYLCDMCEKIYIRYIHLMEHSDYDESLNVGCICAGHMEQDPARADRRERDFKLLQSRRLRWLVRDWRRSRQGNEYLNADGFNVVIYRKDDHWGARVLSIFSGRERVSQRRYETSDAAKMAALMAMLEMKAKEERGDD